MSHYIFTPPAKAYDVPFTHDGLKEFLRKGRDKSQRKLGTTVRVEQGKYSMEVYLYDTWIADVHPDAVQISQYIDNFPRNATTWWVQKILTDNGINGYVGRVQGKYDVAGKLYKI